MLSRNIPSIIGAGILIGGLVFGWSCGSGSSSNDPTIAVRRIGELNGRLADGLATRLKLIPFEPGSDTPVILDGDAIASLTNEEREALVGTYEAGWPIGLLDARKDAIDALLDLVGDGTHFRSASPDVLLAYMIRNVGFSRARLVAEPATTGPAHESALENALRLLVADLNVEPETRPSAQTDDGDQADLQKYPVSEQIFTIPQPNDGAFNTTISLYSARECLTGTDHYVVNAVADWTPGSFYQQASTPTQVGLNEWADGENDVCPDHSDGGSDNTSCRFVDYPKYYRVEMSPQTTGTITQLEAAPEATQGTSTTYESGVTFMIGGEVNIAKGPTATGGAAWSNTRAVTIPALNTEAGNLSNAGAFWQFQYCTTSNTSVTTCVSTLQTANPSGICQDQLGPPQQGQTTNGKFSDAAQTVHWQADADTRQGASSFDIEVSFQAALATTEMRVYKSGGPQPGVFGTCNSCSVFAGCCDCQAETTNLDNGATASAVFQLPFPSTECAN